MILTTMIFAMVAIIRFCSYIGLFELEIELDNKESIQQLRLYYRRKWVTKHNFPII